MRAISGVTPDTTSAYDAALVEGVAAMLPKLTIDRAFGVEEAEGMVIMAGALDDEPTRVQIASDVWRLILDHFNVGLVGGPENPDDKCFVAVEMIGALVMERRGIPQYGVLNVSMD